MNVGEECRARRSTTHPTVTIDGADRVCCCTVAHCPAQTSAGPFHHDLLLVIDLASSWQRATASRGYSVPDCREPVCRTSACGYERPIRGGQSGTEPCHPASSYRRPGGPGTDRPLRVHLAEESNKVLERSPETVHAPRHHHVEPAARGILREPVERRALGSASGALMPWSTYSSTTSQPARSASCRSARSCVSGSWWPLRVETQA
jgi:hypothetical protein